jgi:phage recombination protein Bet
MGVAPSLELQMTHPQTSNQTQSTQKEDANKKKLVGKIAEKFGVDPRGFWDTLKSTAFKQRNGDAPTNEQMMALLIVADQYGLNPFTKEIYAFPDQNNGIIPIVGVDGWSRIINTHPQFDGLEFRFSSEKVSMPNAKECPEWCECIVYRKDRTRPTIVREYLDEVFRSLNYNNPWKSHTKRMLRHKAMIQTARIALGYVGIYDEDEASRIIESQSQATTKQSIEFEEQTQPLPKPQAQSELMSDLNQADFDTFEDAQYVPVDEENTPAQQANATSHFQSSEDDIVKTQFGMLASKDVNMIDQMVSFTVDTGAWDTTKDSFKERYDGATLEYALSTLNEAFNKEFAE